MRKGIGGFCGVSDDGTHQRHLEGNAPGARPPPQLPSLRVVGGCRGAKRRPKVAPAIAP